MALFHAILNIAGINSCVLYMSAAPNESRCEFLKALGKVLACPYMECKMTNTKVPRKLRSLTADILGTSLPVDPIPADDIAKSKREEVSRGPADKSAFLHSTAPHRTTLTGTTFPRTLARTLPCTEDGGRTKSSFDCFFVWD
ncbi:UNVERIFIED_CONTAM: hypothetical protein FKN15_023919 [Acipenser sinensis]